MRRQKQLQDFWILGVVNLTSRKSFAQIHTHTETFKHLILIFLVETISLSFSDQITLIEIMKLTHEH